MVFVSLDARTGLINLRDTGDLGVAGRAPRFKSITDKLNENPAFLLEALVRLRLNVSTRSSSIARASLISPTDNCRYRGAKGQLLGFANVQNAQSLRTRSTYLAF